MNLQLQLDPKLYSDIGDFLGEFPEIIGINDFARRAFTLYLVTKKREMMNDEKIFMMKDGTPTVELIGV
jgi:hypothetical protein